jgi:hypothetical protein
MCHPESDHATMGSSAAQQGQNVSSHDQLPHWREAGSAMRVRLGLIVEVLAAAGDLDDRADRRRVDEILCGRVKMTTRPAR